MGMGIMDFDELEEAEMKKMKEKEVAGQAETIKKEAAVPTEKLENAAAVQAERLEKEALVQAEILKKAAAPQEPSRSNCGKESVEAWVASRQRTSAVQRTEGAESTESTLGGVEANTIALVKAELELEAEAERRRVQCECEGGIYAAMLYVVPSEPCMDQNKFGLKGRSISFCVAVMHSITSILKLLHETPVKNELAEAWTLYPSIVAVELFLRQLMPARFLHGAAKHCERICVFLCGQSQGLHVLISRLLQRDAPHSTAISIFSDVQVVLRRLSKELVHLTDCLLDPPCASLEMINIAREDLLKAASMTKTHAEHLVAARGNAPRPEGKQGDWCCIIRTSPVTCASLLYDLRLAFQDQSFQAQYQELRRKARQNNCHYPEMVNLTFAIQQNVLPKYGFPATAAGVAAMREEAGFYADTDKDTSNRSMSCCGDKVVAKLRRDIHMCLDMDVQKSFRLPLFHTVGDSHSTFGWPECVIQHWQGPLLCYNVDRVDLRALKPPIQEGDAVCFCFGEIDCRCHVHKHCNEDVTYQQVIDGIISSYFHYLDSQKCLLAGRVKFFVYNVPPPVRRCDAQENIQFPYLGEDEERRAYVLYFNEMLRKACKRSGFRYFDVYDRYADEDGFLSSRYSDGNVHISDGVWIDEVISEQKLHLYRASQISFHS